MAKKRRIFSNEFKARIALEAQTGLKSINEIAAEWHLCQSSQPMEK